MLDASVAAIVVMVAVVAVTSALVIMRGAVTTGRLRGTVVMERTEADRHRGERAHWQQRQHDNHDESLQPSVHAERDATTHLSALAVAA